MGFFTVPPPPPPPFEKKKRKTKQNKQSSLKTNMWVKTQNYQNVYHFPYEPSTNSSPLTFIIRQRGNNGTNITLRNKGHLKNGLIFSRSLSNGKFLDFKQILQNLNKCLTVKK